MPTRLYEIISEDGDGYLAIDPRDRCNHGGRLNIRKSQLPRTYRQEGSGKILEDPRYIQKPVYDAHVKIPLPPLRGRRLVDMAKALGDRAIANPVQAQYLEAVQRDEQLKQDMDNDRLAALAVAATVDVAA